MKKTISKQNWKLRKLFMISWTQLPKTKFEDSSMLNLAHTITSSSSLCTSNMIELKLIKSFLECQNHDRQQRLVFPELLNVALSSSSQRQLSHKKKYQTVIIGFLSIPLSQFSCFPFISSTTLKKHHQKKRKKLLNVLVFPTVSFTIRSWTLSVEPSKNFE